MWLYPNELDQMHVRKLHFTSLGMIRIFLLINIVEEFLFDEFLSVTQSFKAVCFWYTWCHTTGILWQSRRSKKNSRSSSVDNMLTRIISNCGINHEKMHNSGTVKSSVFWGCSLELTVCSSSSSHSWCWSEIRFYIINT